MQLRGCMKRVRGQNEELEEDVGVETNGRTEQREKRPWLKQRQVQAAGVTCVVKWFAECQVTAHPVIPFLKLHHTDSL